MKTNLNEIRRTMRYMEDVVDKVDNEGGYIYSLWGYDYSLREVQIMYDGLLEEEKKIIAQKEYNRQRYLRQQQKKAERIAKQQAKQMRWQRRHFTSI